MRWLVFVVIAASVVTALARESRVPVPALVTGKGEACVEPTAIIRRDHMNLLFAQRDATVHRGVRDARHSLAGCVECHSVAGDDGRYVRVDAQGQFCAACHRYAGVRIDCFECHAATPAAASAAR